MISISVNWKSKLSYLETKFVHYGASHCKDIHSIAVKQCPQKIAQVDHGLRANFQGELPLANDGKLYHVNPTLRNSECFFFFESYAIRTAMPFFLNIMWLFSKMMGFMSCAETCGLKLLKWMPQDGLQLNWHPGLDSVPIKHSSCHKPAMTRNGKSMPTMKMEFWQGDGLWHCFAHIRFFLNYCRYDDRNAGFHTWVDPQ